MMRVLLDTNIVLDSLFERRPWHADGDALLRSLSRGELACAVTTLSIANLFYIGRRTVGTVRARTGVRDCLGIFEIVPVDRKTLVRADALPGPDFEDSIQIAAAVIAGLDGIVTRDPRGFAHSPLPVWSPADLLKRLSPQP